MRPPSNCCSISNYLIYHVSSNNLYFDSTTRVLRYGIIIWTNYLHLAWDSFHSLICTWLNHRSKRSAIWLCNVYLVKNYYVSHALQTNQIQHSAWSLCIVSFSYTFNTFYKILWLLRKDKNVVEHFSRLYPFLSSFLHGITKLKFDMLMLDILYQASNTH